MLEKRDIILFGPPSLDTIRSLAEFHSTAPMRALLLFAIVICLLGSGYSGKSKRIQKIKKQKLAQLSNPETSSGHSVPSGRTVAVVYSDIKFDDKMAIHILLQHERASHQRMYDLVIVVITAIVDVKGANIDLRDFLGGMGSYQENRLVVLKGTTEIENKAAGHEVNFVKPNEEVTGINGDYENGIGQFLQNTDTVHLYQIAPTPSRYLEKIRDQPVHVARYHLVHGYNTKQDVTIDVQLRFNFVKSIKEMFPFEQSTVVFTNNYGSFQKNKIGDTQPYSEFEGRVPEKHLHAALMDPFFVKQLTRVLISRNLALLNLVNQQGYSYKDEDLVRLFLLARLGLRDEKNLNFNPRLFFSGLLDQHLEEAIAAVPKETRWTKLRTALTELTVELCDANHVVQVLLNANQFQPMQFEINARQDLVFVGKNEVNEEKKDGDTLYDLTKDDCMKKMRRFLPAKTAAH